MDMPLRVHAASWRAPGRAGIRERLWKLANAAARILPKDYAVLPNALEEYSLAAEKHPGMTLECDGHSDATRLFALDLASAAFWHGLSLRREISVQPGEVGTRSVVLRDGGSRSGWRGFTATPISGSVGTVGRLGNPRPDRHARGPGEGQDDGRELPTSQAIVVGGSARRSVFIHQVLIGDTYDIHQRRCRPA